MGVFPHEHAQCETWINYRISRCNFIADWTIVLGKISIAGLTLDQTSYFQSNGKCR